MGIMWTYRKSTKVDEPLSEGQNGSKEDRVDVFTVFGEFQALSKRISKVFSRRPSEVIPKGFGVNILEDRKVVTFTYISRKTHRSSIFTNLCETLH